MNEKITKYFDLILKSGLDIQPGDYLLIAADVNIAREVQMLVAGAYALGAAEVVVDYRDEQVLRQKGLHAVDEVFDVFPDSRKLFFEEQLAKKAKRLSLVSQDPDILSDVPSSRLMRLERVSSQGMRAYFDAIMGDYLNWTVAGIATPAWAVKVFPELSEMAAMEALWEAIFASVHMNDGADVHKNWLEHVQTLWKRCEILNGLDLTSLHYTNSLGTDIVVGLPESHVWHGGGATNVETGTFFSPNMPTEEVYTAGDANRVEGRVYASLPLLFSGQMIDKFWLDFKDGRVVDAFAEVGDAMLQEILNTDEGSRRFGEVALVDYHSPISLSGLLFYDTLFDENASCHFALGAAYETTLPASVGKTDAEKQAMGLNISLNHIDFMVGTADLCVIGKTRAGQDVEIIKDGLFVI